MTEADIWNNEHLPVLRAAVSRLNAEDLGGVRSEDIANDLGLTPEQVVRTLHRLEDGGLLELRRMNHAIARVVGVSAAAQQLAGAWPTPDNVADRLIAALEQIAQNTDDEDTRNRTRKILDGLAGSGRQIAVGVGTALITGAVQ